MAKPDTMTDEEYYAIVRTWLLPPGISVLVPKARKLMYDNLTKLQRKRMNISDAIFAELEREGIGSGQPWDDRWKTLCKERDERIEAWSDARLATNPPIPQTYLEELLHEHHRLQWAEWNLCDEIEKRWGAVSPFYDTRPDAAPRPCPHV